jgi:hypothetical protein
MPILESSVGHRIEGDYAISLRIIFPVEEQQLHPSSVP